jgi:hypothetical protein
VAVVPRKPLAFHSATTAMSIRGDTLSLLAPSRLSSLTASQTSVFGGLTGWIANMITIELTSQERMVIIKALLYAEARLILEDGYAEIVEKMAASPCGAPGCSYCDPQPEDWQ